MARRFTLPPRRVEQAPGRLRQARAYLLASWPGRLLLAALAVWLLELAGLPLPEPLRALDALLLVGFGSYWGFRLARFGLRRLLWRIRTKLLVSYLFIAVVPVVLLALFFVIAALLSVSLVASYMVASQIRATAEQLKTVAHAAAVGLSPGDDSTAELQQRLAPARALHPGLSLSFVRGGRVLAALGDAPRELPGWLSEKGEFAGLVRVREGEDVIRAAWSDARGFLVLQLPLDKLMSETLEKRTGIRVLQSPLESEVNQRGNIVIRNRRRGRGAQRSSLPSPSSPASPQAGAAPSPAAPSAESAADSPEAAASRATPEPGAAASGSPGATASPSPEPPEFAPRSMQSFALVDRTEWDTGKTEIEPLAIRLQPMLLLRQLSPTSGDIGEIVLVRGLQVVGGTFLVMYGVAFVIGLLLARSITKSVHALSVGTERLRQGDFAHTIRAGSRDQLGELAESFNLMSRGIQDLLREQAEKERLEEELRIARQIQMSLLPQGAVSLPGLRIAALCLPAAEVGGDYYDLLPLSETRMGVLIADVSGKGTSAALYMAELKGLVLSLSRIYASPAKLLAEANSILSANMDTRSFVTMTYAVVDIAERTMRYARAGHNPVIQLEASTGRTRVLAPQGLGLGIDRGNRFEQILEEAEVPLRSGDIFLFFTDGLSEAMNERSELFGERRLRDLLESAEPLGSSEQLRERILEEIRAFVGEAAQHDDMTLVILKVI